MAKLNLVTIEEIIHWRDGKPIWQDQNLPNVWHIDGHEFLLSLAFDTDNGISVPSQYYLGLDSRSVLAEEDTLENITNEPDSNGYIRQAFSSTTGFAIGIKDGKMTATSGIATFIATGSQWGPVKNAFLATSISDSGYLISSIALNSSRTVLAGDSMTVRINLALGGCS